jgi:AcrR family transcriptional regulator
MKTKDKITNKALELFNKFGTNAVSTNHIAKALEMSPGNLYYHFKNKEEIIQELLKKMIEEYDSIFSNNNLDNESNILQKLIFDDIQISIKYKVIYNELSSLFKNDNELKEIFIKNQKKREVFLLDLFLKLQKNGYIFENISEFVLKTVIDTIWFLENFRFLRYELKEKNINKVEDLKHQEILLERLIPLYGFLTDKGKDFFNTSEILKNI